MIDCGPREKRFVVKIISTVFFSHIILAHVTPASKTDPIMLLMAAAKVVDGNDLKSEKRKRHHNQRSIDREAYPNGRYYLKQGNNKRIRTSPPSPAPTYKVDTWQKTKVQQRHGILYYILTSIPGVF